MSEADISQNGVNIKRKRAMSIYSELVRALSDLGINQLVSLTAKLPVFVKANHLYIAQSFLASLPR